MLHLLWTFIWTRIFILFVLYLHRYILLFIRGYVKIKYKNLTLFFYLLLFYSYFFLFVNYL